MTNLLKETLHMLAENGKTWDDVISVQGHEHAISKEHFTKIADAEYYNGFGAAEVATDLVIVGRDWWLERHEYDGAESWKFKQMPTIIQEKSDSSINALVGGCWNSLAEINNPEKDNDES